MADNTWSRFAHVNHVAEDINVASSGAPKCIVQCDMWFTDNNAFDNFPNSVPVYHYDTREENVIDHFVGLNTANSSQLCRTGDVKNHGTLIIIPDGLWTPNIQGDIGNKPPRTITIHNIIHINDMACSLKTIEYQNAYLVACKTTIKTVEMLIYAASGKIITYQYEANGNPKGQVAKEFNYVQGLSKDVQA